jgi:hypothetical protein
MAELNISSATTTSFSSQVPDYIVNARSLDIASPNPDESYWYFDKATTYFGYYMNVPEIFCAANALATWAFGAGWSTEDTNLKEELEHVTGSGKDTFLKIIWNAEVVKLVVGDAFVEVKRKDDRIVNLVPISPERVRIVFNRQGMIKRYDTWNGTEWREIKKENMLHLINKKIGDQMHGTSQIESNTFEVTAIKEALSDERTIKHRDKALGIVYYKTDKAGKILYANQQIEKAVRNGEMVGLPEDTAKIEPYPSRSSEDRSGWIELLTNRFYRNFGVPRSIASSEGTSEVGGKIGMVTFEPTYAKERIDMEDDLWNQQAIKVKFEKQLSLGGLVKQEEAKNTGQTNIQPNDVTANMERE